MRTYHRPAKPDKLAAFLMAVLDGMAVQAKAGLNREVLTAVAKQALTSWPSADVAHSTK
ncbi:hypothetical protein [Phyllobacterium sp. YR531]|uniref:hypothetical protein n=1 Tax=Phyllobacterium sp. YR531 TaxID=1144343 RepID=UPI00026F52A9|nr:hypothetical protein [Phyllobacterium sp. YR531]EJN02478.1 hypothetical protein PMI41_03230 [Phyllobacterium sp. YR531]